MKLKNYSFSGFTLAEVLITIGIIGVIAALTLPVLISNNRAKALEAGLKKGASVINQALLQYQAENGEPVKADGDIGRQKLKNLIIKYFNVIHDCGYAYSETQNVGCISNVGSNPDESSKVYKTLNGTTNINLSYFDDAQFILTDGSIILIENGNILTRIYISIDTNGYLKKPNRLGQDLFMFQINEEGKLLPMGAKGTDYYSENDEYCSPTSTNNMNGAGCTYKALNEPRYFLELK